MSLPAGLGCSVLLLPSLACGVEAFLPRTGLGVEALGVLVLAVLVVLGEHAVQCRVELGAVGVDRLVGLLERQRDATTLEVDVDDLDEDLFADGHDLLSQLDVLAGELGDVHEALDAVCDANERTERNELGDLARCDLADRVGAGEDLPRVFLRRLERQGDALALQVDLEDLDSDFLSDLDDLGGVLDVLPGQFGDVHEAVNATQVDERTEVDDRRDLALADLALVQVVEEVRARLGLRLLEQRAAAQHDVVAVLVQLEDLRLDLLAQVRGQVADTAQLDERCRQEATQADVDDESTLDDLDDRTGDDAVVFLDLLDVAPRTLVLRALLGQDQTAFLVLLLENKSLDLIADLDDLVGVDIVLDGEFAGGDDTLGLVSDVEQDLIAVDLDDRSFDDVAVVEELQSLLDRGQEVLSRSDVVDGDLLGGRGGRCGSHVVGCPCGWVLGPQTLMHA